MKTWILFICVLVATFVVASGSIVTVIALDPIQGELALSDTVIQWATTLFLLGVNTIVPAATYLSSRFGLKQMFLAGVLLSALGSLITGLAFDFPSLAIGRFVEGIGGGLIFTIGFALTTVLFPKERLHFAIGLYFTAAFGCGLGIGTPLLGWLVQQIGWRAPFLFFVATLTLIWAIVEWAHSEVEKVRQLPFNMPGYLLFTVSICSLLVALSNGNLAATDEGWQSLWILGLIALSIVCLIGTFAYERRHESPLFPRALFTNPLFFTCSLAIFLVGTALFSSLTLMIGYMVDSLHYQRDVASTYTLWFGVFLSLFTVISALLMRTFPAMWLGVLGLGCLLAGDLYASTFTLESMPRQVIFFLFLRGLGIGLSLGPLSTEAVRQIPRELLAQAAILLTFIRQVGATYGNSLLSILEIRRTIFHAARFGEQINDQIPGYKTALRDVAARLQPLSDPLASGMIRAKQALILDVLEQATVAGISDAIFFFAYPTGVIILALIFLNLRYRNRATTTP